MKSNIRDLCKGCSHYKVLNPHHIVDKEPYKSCDMGEFPEFCDELKKHHGQALLGEN